MLGFPGITAVSGKGKVIESLLLLFFFFPSLFPRRKARKGLFLPSKSLGGGMIKSSVLFDDVSSPDVSHWVFSSVRMLASGQDLPVDE